MSNPTPLRIQAGNIPADREYLKEGSSGAQRITDIGAIISAMRLANRIDTPLSNGRGDASESFELAELTLRKLEAAKRHGTINDTVTVLLGIRQTPRYAVDGRDNVIITTELLALAAANQDTPEARKENGGKPVRFFSACNFDTGCISKPITFEETTAVITPNVPASPELNKYRVFGIGPAMASILAFNAATNRPEVATGTKSPAELLAADRAANPGVDVVQKYRQDMKECIRQDPSSLLGLKDCVKAGARTAIYNIALTGPFVEVDPMQLAPIPDSPIAKQREASNRTATGAR